MLILTTTRFPEFAEAVWRATSGNFALNKRLMHLQAREVTVEADPPIAVQIDGDPAGLTPMTARVERGALRVLVPA